jgi:uncharacterized protein (TIGR03084 family)
MLLQTVLDDLRAEQDELDALVADLPAERWAASTPSEGWTIAHQIAHLAWADDAAVLAITDKPGFLVYLKEVLADPQDHVNRGASAGVSTPPADLLARWRASRAAVLASLRRADAGEKLTWFGPPLNLVSLATVRLMEVWAHGMDIADALGVQRTPTHRLRHIAYLGVRTRDYSFHLKGLTPPDPFRVELTGPDGQLWTWGPPEAEQRVTGPALDFCMVTTHRVHRDDTALVTVGDNAERWLGIAQSFAGPSGPGRPAGRIVSPRDASPR